MTTGQLACYKTGQIKNSQHKYSQYLHFQPHSGYHMPKHMHRNEMLPERHVKLFRNGSNQALRIPREFELAGNEAIVRKDGDRLIIESVKPHDLIGLLAAWELLDDDFPNIDSGLLPLDDVIL